MMTVFRGSATCLLRIWLAKYIARKTVLIIGEHEV
jgi:hypothetical protein